MKKVAAHLSLVLGLLLLSVAPSTRAATAPRSKVFLPRDAAMHQSSPNEWWYYTGHLRDAAGHSYGFELVNFKFSQIKKLQPLSPFDSFYRIDIAVTDEARHTFYPMVNYILPGSGTGVLSTKQLYARMKGPDGSLAEDTLPGTAPAYRLRGTNAHASLDLQVVATRSPLLEGGTGLVPEPGGFSYYYSLTNMRTTGTLTVDGTPRAVTGTTWMDHQWGSWSWQKTFYTGWDWMAIELGNGISFDLWDFLGGHTRSGKSAAISMPDGRTIVTHDATMTPFGPLWISPRTKTRYPQAWHVKVPSLGLDATVAPTMHNQEMVDTFSSATSYWEGSGLLTGTLHGKPISGLTYTELVGYGKQAVIGL